MEGGKKILNFLTTFSGWKGLRCRLKARVQIKAQPWPFRNCLPSLATWSFIDKDDFWSIVKLVANARRRPIAIPEGLKVSERHQCWIDRRSWEMPACAAPAACSGLCHGASRPTRSVTSPCAAQLFLQFSINSEIKNWRLLLENLTSQSSVRQQTRQAAFFFFFRSLY